MHSPAGVVWPSPAGVVWSPPEGVVWPSPAGVVWPSPAGVMWPSPTGVMWPSPAGVMWPSPAGADSAWTGYSHSAPPPRHVACGSRKGVPVGGGALGGAGLDRVLGLGKVYKVL